MSDLLHKFLHILTDKTTSLTRRTSFFLLCLFLTLLANDTFNFSFNYRTNQRIEQLKNIYALYPKNTIDTARVTKTLRNIEDEVLNRKAYISQIKNIYSNIKDNKLNLIQKKFLQRCISANVIYVMLMIIFIFTEKNKNEIKSIFFGISVFALIINLLLMLVPNFENIIWNHIINVSFSILTIIGIVIYENRKK